MFHPHQSEHPLQYVGLAEKHEQGFLQVHRRESCHDDLQETEFNKCPPQLFRVARERSFCFAVRPKDFYLM